jgi:hypothetical protein
VAFIILPNKAKVKSKKAKERKRKMVTSPLQQAQGIA